MQIGKKIYYDNTGKIIAIRGELYGDVSIPTFDENKLMLKELNGYKDGELNELQLEYGYMVDEIEDAGSLKVINGELIVYPKLTLVKDGNFIAAQINDMEYAGDCIFSVEGIEGQMIIEFEYGKAAIEFLSDMPGFYTVKAQNELYGVNFIVVEVL